MTISTQRAIRIAAFCVVINVLVLCLAAPTAQAQHARRSAVSLGLQADSVDQGVRVTSVDDAGPAAVAGLQVGDILTQVDGALGRLAASGIPAVTRQVGGAAGPCPRSAERIGVSLAAHVGRPQAASATTFLKACPATPFAPAAWKAPSCLAAPLGR